MSDEDIIKKRLLIDGDGTGDDRRLNMLLKQFLKWTYSKNDSPESNQIVYDRLLAQLAQCEFAAAKAEHTSNMIQEELDNYAKLSDSIENSIGMAKREIEEKKKELVVAKQIRKNKMQYDMLAKVIKEQPDRKETTKQIETLKRELNELIEKKIKLDRKFEKRQKDFTVLMYAINELQSELENDSSSESEKDDDDKIDDGVLDLSEDELPSTSQAALKVKEDSETPEKMEIDTPESKEETTSATPIDEETVLELSIDKDDNDVKNM